MPDSLNNNNTLLPVPQYTEKFNLPQKNIQPDAIIGYLDVLIEDKLKAETNLVDERENELAYQNFINSMSEDYRHIPEEYRGQGYPLSENVKQAVVNKALLQFKNNHTDDEGELNYGMRDVYAELGWTGLANDLVAGAADYVPETEVNRQNYEKLIGYLDTYGGGNYNEYMQLSSVLGYNRTDANSILNQWLKINKPTEGVGEGGGKAGGYKPSTESIRVWNTFKDFGVDLGMSESELHELDKEILDYAKGVISSAPQSKLPTQLTDNYRIKFRGNRPGLILYPTKNNPDKRVFTVDNWTEMEGEPGFFKNLLGLGNEGKFLDSPIKPVMTLKAAQWTLEQEEPGIHKEMANIESMKERYPKKYREALQDYAAKMERITGEYEKPELPASIRSSFEEIATPAKFDIEGHGGARLTGYEALNEYILQRDNFADRLEDLSAELKRHRQIDYSDFNYLSK
jgi:hypothetical protein